MSPSINAHSHIYWMSKLSWLLVFMLVFLHSSTHGIPVFEPSDCILSNSEDDCKVGAFNINMNKPNCPPRFTCYRNFNEPCHMYGGGKSNCLPPYVCDCDICRKRETAHICFKNVESPLNLPKRMKPIYPEYFY